MSVIDHLRELRRRLVVVVLIIAVGAVFGWIFYQPILDFLKHPYCSVPSKYRYTPAGTKECVLTYHGVLDGFTARLKVSVIAGAVLTGPLWLYQIWAFITPGLRKNERKYTVVFVVASTLLFVAGMGMAYLVLAKGMRVLLEQATTSTQAILTVTDYLGFVTLMLVVFGAAFELPLLVVMANFAGVLSAKMLKKSQRLSIFLIFVFAAVATPSTDPFTMCAMAIPMCVLFEGAVVIASVHDRRKARRLAVALGEEPDDNVPSRIDPIPPPAREVGRGHLTSNAADRAIAQPGEDAERPLRARAHGKLNDGADRRWALATRYRPLAAAVLPPLVWIAASLYNYSAFVSHPSRGVVGGPDGILYGWYFQLIEHSLAGSQLPFVSTAMNAPVGVSIMWNTSLLLPAVVCAPLTALFGGLAVAGWLMVLAPVLSASAAYWVLYRLTGRALGCALVASLYGFGPFFVGHSGHLNLILAAPLLPFVLLLGRQLLLTQDRGWVRPGVWLGVVVAAGMLISEEVIAMAAVVGCGAVLSGVIVRPALVRPRLRIARQGLGIAAGVALVLLAVPLYYQFFGRLALHGGVDQPNQPLDLEGLFRASGLQYYASHGDILVNTHFPANGVENTGYLGWPLLLVVTGTVIWLAIRRDRFAYWWALLALGTVLLSFGPVLWVGGRARSIRLPWDLIRHLPLFGSVITVRFSLITTLLVALLLAYGLARLSSPRRYALGLAVVLLCLVSLRPVRGGPYDEIDRIATPRFFTTSAVDAISPGATVLLLPQGNGPFAAQVPMYWQIRAHMRFDIVGGYSVFDRDGHSNYSGELPALATVLQATGTTGVAPSPSQAAAARASVGPSAIRYIVITDQLAHPDSAARVAAELTGCVPRAVADVTLCQLPRG